MSDAPKSPSSPTRGSLRADGGHGRRRLGEILIERGVLDEETLASALAEQARLDLVDPTAVEVSRELIVRFDIDLARRHRMLPLYVDDGGRVTVAFADPTDLGALKAAGRYLDAPVDPVVAPGPALDQAIEAAFERAQAPPEAPPASTLDVPAAPPPIGPLSAAVQPGANDDDAWTRLLAGLVSHMLQLEADRLRFAAWDGGATGQLRVTARWARVLALEGGAAAGLIDGLVEAFEADDDGILRLGLGGAGEGRDLIGRVSLREGGRQLDIRLVEPESSIALADLGFDAEVQRRVRQWTASREGLLLVVGPDASGRTTTLSALAESLAQYREVVLVGEAPAPAVPGVTFLDGSSGPYAISDALRLHPKVLVVDDVEEGEVASAVFAAAKDDCLVIAGVPGHDAHDALQSLRDRGVPDALMGERLIGVIEQRLLRALCAACRTKGAPRPDAVSRLGLKPSALPSEIACPGSGCARCHGHGTHGKVLLATRVEIGGGIVAGSSAADLRGLVDRARPRAAQDSGLALVLSGQAGLNDLAMSLTMSPRPVVSAEGGGWMPGMPEETVEASAPVLESGSFEGFLELEPDRDADDRHILLLFDPKDDSYKGISAIVPAESCRVVAASEWEDAMSVVRSERPTAILLLAAGDPVATRGRIRAFRDDLASAFLPICVLVAPGTPDQDLLETGADVVLPVADAPSVRSGLLALLARIT
jgi:type IV pilus assembly protein PilB